MNKKYAENEILFIKDNYNKLSARQIAEYLNRPLSSIQDKISSLNLKKESCSNAKWGEEEIKFLEENYQKLSYHELCAFLNRTEKSIKVKAHKLGLKKDGIYYSHSKFESISTEEDAYWLGFLYADGYVVQSTHEYFGVELQKSDEEHLRKLNKYMEGNATIYYRSRKSPSSDNYFENCSIMYNGTDLVNNLISQGCIPNKSFTLQFPKHIDDALMCHFIRGYFDGNGSFGKYNKNRYLRATISCASIDFIKQLQFFLKEKNIESSIYDDMNCYKLYIVGKNNPQKFLDYMYKTCDIFLTRKYKQYNFLCA